MAPIHSTKLSTLVVKVAKVQDTTRKSRLQHLGSTAHPLDKGKEDKQGHKPLVLPSRGSYIGMTDVAHALNTEVPVTTNSSTSLRRTSLSSQL